jgi:hypothetical protein
MAKSYGCKDFCWIIGAPAQKKGSEGRWRECSGTLDGDHYRCLYESSPDVSAFFSEFDAYLGGNATFTAAETERLQVVQPQSALQSKTM